MRASLVVTTPATKKRLATEAVVRAVACISAEVPKATVELLIDAASSAIARIVNVAADQDGGQTLGLESVTETWRFQAGGSLLRNLPLARWPVRELVSVTEGDTTIARQIDLGAGLVDNPAFVYQARASNGLLLKLDGTGGLAVWGGPQIVVAYRAGYGLPEDNARTLPPDIEYACALLVRRKLEQLDQAAHAALKSESFAGVGSWTWAVGDPDWSIGAPSEVLSLLKPYIRRSV